MEDLNGVQISDIFGLKEPLTKLVECVSRGIGKVYEPAYIKRIAKAKSSEIKMIGEAVTNNLNLPTKYDSGNVLIDTTSIDELVKRTENRLIYQEIRKQQNLESIIAGAYNELDKENRVSDEPVNEDWLFKFFDLGGSISDEKMQQIWSKILAGEIKSPNTYTLRTLDTLKNITQSEAQLFREISKFKFLHNTVPFIVNNIEILNKYNCTYANLLKLEDCGLMSLNGFVNLNLKDEEKNYIYTDKIVAIINNKMKIGIYTFTESGKQILSLIENDTDFKYSIEVIRFLRDKKNSIKVYKINSVDECSISYDERIDLFQKINK